MSKLFKLRFIEEMYLPKEVVINGINYKTTQYEDFDVVLKHFGVVSGDELFNNPSYIKFLKDNCLKFEGVVHNKNIDGNMMLPSRKSSLSYLERSDIDNWDQKVKNYNYVIVLSDESKNEIILINRLLINENKVSSVLDWHNIYIDGLTFKELSKNKGEIK